MLHALADIANNNLTDNHCTWYRQIHILQHLSHAGRPSDVVYIRARIFPLPHFHPIFFILPLEVHSYVQCDALKAELSDRILPITSYPK